jgi:hypothetical protein
MTAWPVEGKRKAARDARRQKPNTHREKRLAVDPVLMSIPPVSAAAHIIE